MARQTDTRSRMLETAAHLLWVQGFNATGLNQIVEESGTPKGSLYFHFPGGKEQLTAEAIRTAGRKITRSITKTIQEHDNPGDSVRAFVDAFARNMNKSDFHRGCPVATVALETAAASEAIRTACDEVFSEYLSLVSGSLVRRGFPPHRAQALATLILSAVEGALILARARRDTEPLETVAEELATLLGTSAPHRR